MTVGTSDAHRWAAAPHTAGLPRPPSSPQARGAVPELSPHLDDSPTRGHVVCLDVTAADEAELVELARGRFLLIDCLMAPRLVPFPVDVRLHWVADPASLPVDAVRVDDLRRIRAFVLPSLGPVLARVRARVVVRGPRRVRFMRHPALSLPSGAAWSELFDALRELGPVG